MLIFLFFNKKLILKSLLNFSELSDLNIDVKNDNNIIEINYSPDEVDFGNILSILDKSAIEITDMKIIESNLEDVFLKLTKR